MIISKDRECQDVDFWYNSREVLKDFSSSTAFWYHSREVLKDFRSSLLISGIIPEKFLKILGPLY
jgi:hypothetical protein